MLYSEKLIGKNNKSELDFSGMSSGLANQDLSKVLDDKWYAFLNKVLLEPSKYLWQEWSFDSKCNFAPPTIVLGLLLCPWTWGIFFWWDPTFFCQWLFSNELQFLNSCKRWALVLLLYHLSNSVFLPWEPHEQYERQKDMILKDKLPRSVGAQYATGEEWRNSFRKNEETEAKQRKKRKKKAQLWMWQVMEVKSDAVMNNIA